MKKTISVYWPLAFVVPLIALAYLHIGSQLNSRAPQARLDANRLTAELARAVSYGMIDPSSALPAKAVRGAAAMPVAEAS